MKPFIDEVVIFVKSGDGGNGAISFHREKYVPKGGPDGGDGGKGGDVVFISDSRLNSLSHLKNYKHYKAGNGQNGSGNNCSGKKGKDLIIKVPVGTVLYDEENNIIFDFKEKDQKFVYLRGGKGGLGNQHFATPTNQSPRIATEGKKGIEKKVKIVLKLIADIGLVGYPNAGKSTFLSVVTKAHPKIANYPFTTLYPNLGRFTYDGKKFFYIADIPGIIEGASHGKGMGLKFLRHIERTKVLLYIIDGMGFDYFMQFKTLKGELKEYSKVLVNKPYIVAISKIDLPDTLERFEIEKKKFDKENIVVYGYSAITGSGLRKLLNALSSLVINHSE